MRIVVNLKKNEITDVVLNKLFKHTAMEVNYSIIFLAIDDGMPKVFSIKELLEKFLLFRKDVILKRTAHELKKSQEQCHILDGLRKALENIDLVLKIIRGSEDPRVAAQNLMQRVGLSEKQARAILDMRLQRLTRLEKQKLLDEHAELVKKIADLENILADEKRVKAIVKEELLEIRSNYADERRTDIVEEMDEITYEDMIFEENMVVTITHKGYIKRTPLSMYKTQKRGGRGKVGITIGDEDFVQDLFISSTHSYFLIFTDMGRVHWLKVHEIPEASRIAKGKPIVNLVTLQEGEGVASILPIKEFREGTFVLMATQKGVVKRTDVKAFSHPRAAGIHAITLDEGDKLISTMLTSGTEKLFLATMNGKAVKMEETQIRSMGRSARGIRGLRLRDNDCLIAMINISNVDPILTVTERGFGKRTPVESYRVQRRGGKGLTNVRITPKNGTVVNVLQVSNSDNIILITDLGKLIRIKGSEIKQVGRSAIGVKLINLVEGETVVAAQKILEED
jgi:DNA gyrase subunit A